MDKLELIKQLEAEIKQLDDDVNRLSCMEQAVKIVLNGGYGALGNPTFRYYDETIAEGITATGRVGIQYITKKINEFINNEAKTVGVDYIVSSDTDSVVGSTVIRTSIGSISIEDLYNTYTNIKTELKGHDKNSVRTLTEKVESLSFDGTKIESNNINYIMKHRVKKQMYRIKCKDTFVDVTADHSIIVMRDNVMTSIKPGDIEKGDQLVKIVT